MKEIPVKITTYQNGYMVKCGNKQGVGRTLQSAIAAFDEQVLVSIEHIPLFSKLSKKHERTNRKSSRRN